MTLFTLLIKLLFILDTSKGHIEVTAQTNAMFLQKVIFTTPQHTYEWVGFGENNTIIGKTSLEPNTPYKAEVFFSSDNGETWRPSAMKTSQKNSCVLIGSEDSNDLDYDDAQIIVCNK